MEVTREHVHDGTRLKGLVEESSKRVDVKGVIGDGAYDSRRNFNLLEERGIEPIIKVRRNAVKLRWIAESAFSWLKRVFGEYVTAKNLKNMI